MAVHRAPELDMLIFRPVAARNTLEETVERLAHAIKLGVVPPGERFPPERTLAPQLGISRVTLREALRTLEQGGYVESRRGRNGGAYVTRRKGLDQTIHISSARRPPQTNDRPHAASDLGTCRTGQTDYSGVL